MKNKARSIFFSLVIFMVSLSIGYHIPREEVKNSQIVSSGSIIYEHGFPNAGGAALLVLDDKERLKILESEIKLLEEEKDTLERINNELDQENKLKELSSKEWEYLYRVTRAEAGANSHQAQKNVVYVILNRLNSDKFPNSIEEIIFQKSQFSCVSNKSFYKVELSEDLKATVQEAYLDYEENLSANGALFFTKGYFPRTFLFEDCVGHTFYK